MSSNNDTVSKTFIVALVLCLVCSILVSVAAVSLRPLQDVQAKQFKQKNILTAAGLYQDGDDVAELFRNVTAKVVDLETGEYTTAVDPDSYDQKAAAKNPKMSKRLESDVDIAGIMNREKYATVYTTEKNGKLDLVILPIHGKGLFSTLYGFVALKSDMNTIVGISYYEHGETPGLGGEVDNANWKAKWPQKEINDSAGQYAFKLVKGGVTPTTKNAENKVDALAGATYTTRGVENMMRFWLGENGFGPFMKKQFVKGA
jgi:Na+-transporting NADH:ubiquinone oxidoreductase subunit C